MLYLLSYETINRFQRNFVNVHGWLQLERYDQHILLSAFVSFFIIPFIIPFAGLVVDIYIYIYIL